jgi:hypothetical protein
MANLPQLNTPFPFKLPCTSTTVQVAMYLHHCSSCHVPPPLIISAHMYDLCVAHMHVLCVAHCPPQLLANHLHGFQACFVELSVQGAREKTRDVYAVNAHNKSEYHCSINFSIVPTHVMSGGRRTGWRGSRLRGDAHARTRRCSKHTTKQQGKRATSSR